MVHEEPLRQILIYCVLFVANTARFGAVLGSAQPLKTLRRSQAPQKVISDYVVFH